jgi:hypothetical protein
MLVASIVLLVAGLGGYGFCWCYENFDGQLFFSSDPILDSFSRRTAASHIQLVRSVSDIFSGWFIVFYHGNLLGCPHDGQTSSSADVNCVRLLAVCCDADFDLLRLGLFTLGHMQSQDTVAVVGANVFRVDCVRQRKAPHE